MIMTEVGDIMEGDHLNILPTGLQEITLQTTLLTGAEADTEAGRLTEVEVGTRTGRAPRNIRHTDMEVGTKIGLHLHTLLIEVGAGTETGLHRLTEVGADTEIDLHRLCSHTEV